MCFSWWLNNSAKKRLFLVDLKRLPLFAEYAAEGAVDLRWSADGSKAYAVTSDGLTYITRHRGFKVPQRWLGGKSTTPLTHSPTRDRADTRLLRKHAFHYTYTALYFVN